MTAQFPLGAVEDFINAVPQIVGAEITRALSYLGEQCVKRIRDRGPKESWYDRTGNLRSSIGYAVFDHGRRVIASAFETVAQGSAGSESGRKSVGELADMYAQTYALVCVAGMEYAEYVEAMENKDVLASTQLWATSKIDGYLDKARLRAEDKISRLQRQLGL